jgi:hypothetical protein
VIRVPAMTGFPIMMFGSDVIGRDSIGSINSLQEAGPDRGALQPELTDTIYLWGRAPSHGRF